MTIRPVVLGGMIQRTDDVGQIKHQQDAKPMMDQQNIQMQVNKREDHLAHKVQETGNKGKMNNNTDAKEESRGKYFKNNSKKKKNVSDGKVVKKNSDGIFDIKI